MADQFHEKLFINESVGHIITDSIRRYSESDRTSIAFERLVSALSSRSLIQIDDTIFVSITQKFQPFIAQDISKTRLN